jgi:hypothetical protein
MRSRGELAAVRCFSFRGISTGAAAATTGTGREQQGVQHLLGDDFEWSPKARGDVGARLALGHVQVDRHRPWEEKLPREEVHLDLPPLPPAVVHDAVHPDGRSFRGARRVDVVLRAPPPLRRLPVPRARLRAQPGTPGRKVSRWSRGR